MSSPRDATPRDGDLGHRRAQLRGHLAQRLDQGEVGSEVLTLEARADRAEVLRGQVPHTAHDADRVAVVEAGRVTELGTHDDLVAAGGAYAALWRSWHGTG
ncbi:hypothetical protein Misp01_58000 [Microtetraspora sp. NBRC 13810]|uniref:hypothetical protein n=1 Tax=Microtetraspora sp. NBRC 13810 TaxID=3030990 RepID=UPI0024A38751|nr:hypothetical protein [Microtetraspora sp. NBRC 13810]GLW10672.1 hypothetical protein Misp01_58000 [Microtetraspora sp. NBRC 13810]